MQKTLKNRSIFCRDNLEVLRGIDSNTVDLIYLDPPFNKKKEFTAPIGSTAEGASFQDYFRQEDIKEEWLGLIAEGMATLYQYINSTGEVGHKSTKYYLCYMAIRLIEMQRVLNPRGSLYLHCDQTMGHYLKGLLDCIFGAQNFRASIIWKRHTSAQKGSQHAPKSWANTTDYIFHYTKSKTYRLDNTRALRDSEIERKFPLVDVNGKRYYNDSAHLFRDMSMGERPNLCYEWRGFRNPSPAGWRLSKERLEEEYQKGNIVITDKGKLERRKYTEDYRGVPLSNLWDDINPAAGDESVGYPTQKPVALLERIIRASSSEGDFVLDPFCGCATTCVAAEKLGRHWVGIDISTQAFHLVRDRLQREVYENVLFKASRSGGKIPRVVYREDVPQRCDLGGGKEQVRNVKHFLFGRQEGLCGGCKTSFGFRHFHIDHIVPQSKGGGDNIENLQLLCGHCNSIKGDRDMPYLLKILRERGYMGN